MRTLLKIHMDTQTTNEPARRGELAKAIETMVDDLKPEATYFFPENGQRSAYIFFDLADTSRIPVICEPLFNIMGATVELQPVMNLDDLRRGLSEITG